eukprot:355041_1
MAVSHLKLSPSYLKLIGFGFTSIGIGSSCYVICNASNIARCERSTHQTSISHIEKETRISNQKLYDFVSTYGAISIPWFIGGIMAILSYREWQSRRFLNVMNISLNCVQKSNSINFQFPLQYSLYTRTIKECEVRNIILHDKGAKLLCKAATKCRHNDQFIRMEGAARRNVCNFIGNQITSICSVDFLKRDILNHNPKTIRSSMYIFGLMAHCNQQKDILRLRKIFVLLIKEKTILDLLKQFPNIEIITDKEWEIYLKGCMDTNFEHRNRWNMIKEILIEYKKQNKDRYGTLEWAEPLCDLELTTSIDPSLQIDDTNDNDDIYIKNPERQPFNSWRKLIRRGPKHKEKECPIYEQEEFVGDYRAKIQKEKRLIAETLKTPFD